MRIPLHQHALQHYGYLPRLTTSYNTHIYKEKWGFVWIKCELTLLFKKRGNQNSKYKKNLDLISNLSPPLLSGKKSISNMALDPDPCTVTLIPGFCLSLFCLFNFIEVKSLWRNVCIAFTLSQLHHPDWLNSRRSKCPVFPSARLFVVQTYVICRCFFKICP